MKNAASFEPVQPEQVKFIVNNNQVNNNDSRIRVKQNKVVHVIVYSVVGLLLIGSLILLIFLLTKSSESSNSKKTNISSVNSASIFEPIPNNDQTPGSPITNIDTIPEFIERPTDAPNIVSNSVPNSNPSQSNFPSFTQNSVSNPLPEPVPSPISPLNPNTISNLNPTIFPTPIPTPIPNPVSKPIDRPVPDAVPNKPSNFVPISGQISFPPYSFVNTTKVDPELESRRQLMKDMFLDSWNTYKQHAWGNEALRPVSKSSYSETFGDNSGLTIVTSMSTLWMMGLKKKFEQGKAWIAQNLDLSKIDADVRVFEIVTHYVGGLLSTYALTGDRLFLNKAFEIGKLVTPAFNTPTGIPYERINFETRSSMDENPLLSNVAGFKVNFDYLSAVSNNPTFRNLTSKIFKLLQKKPRKLYHSVINIDGNFASAYSSLFADSRELFINLVKSFILSDRKDVQSIEMYKKALDGMESVNIFQNALKIHNHMPPYYYAQGFDSKTNTTGGYMEYSGCYLGAMLSMGSNSMKKALEVTKYADFNQNQIEKDRIMRHWQLGGNLTETCYQASSRSQTGLGPLAFYLHFKDDWAGNPKHYVSAYKDYNEYQLSSELAESYFIQWRLTHNSKYRDYAWKMVQAINKHCKVESGGYSGIRNVNELPISYVNHQSPLFMSATLKYLYLTFTDDTELPLEHWVFNSVGHPLPICGRNPANPKSICKH